MRILFFLTLTAFLFFSCKKNSTVPGGSQTISGNLRYSDPAVDGAGLFYEEDNGNLLLFKNE